MTTDTPSRGHLRAVPAGTPPPARRGSAASVSVEAPGHVTLLLAAGAPGPGGRRALTTVHQCVRLIERVTARRQGADDVGRTTLRLEEPDRWETVVPMDGRNLAVRAARLLAERTGVTEGVDLTVRRRVPVSSGMAGAAADAAATLVACNALWGTGLSHAELGALARVLDPAAPVPLAGMTSLLTGEEEPLVPLMARGTYVWVLGLTCPAPPLAEVLARHEELGAPAGEDAPTLEDLTVALGTGDPAALAPVLRNDLQEAVVSLCPQVGQALTTAEEAGALRAVVSGAGTTVAALVPSAGAASRVARALEASGSVTGTVRTDAPVPGARVVR